MSDLFAQDSWRVLPNLTLNYGLRWDRIAPWTEKYNQISTFVAGAQSVVFPGAPAGILYPGDPGVPNTLAPVSNLNFAPRVGFAWSPQAESRQLPGKASGSAGNDEHSRKLSAISILRFQRSRSEFWPRTHLMAPHTPVPRRRCLRRHLSRRPMARITASRFPIQFAPLNSSRSNPGPEYRLEHL